MHTIDEMKNTFFLTLLFLFCISACRDEETPSATVASASLFGVSLNADDTYTSNATPYGEVTLEDLGASVRLTVTLTNATPNYRHAVHLHMGSCEQPGHHWNQGREEGFCNEMNLGEIWARPKAGDVGNVNTDSNGNGTLVVESEFWALNTNDQKDLIGAVLIVHENMEDFVVECFDDGHDHVHMNPKIACGSIELR